MSLAGKHQPPAWKVGYRQAAAPNGRHAVAGEYESLGERLNDKKMNRARNSHVEEGLPSVTMMKSVKTRKSGGGTILRLAYDI